MLKKLSKSSRAVKELKIFEKEISNISNEQARKRGLNLISKLKDQNNIIDSAHSVLSAADINNEKIKENAEKLIKIRQEIVKLIKDSKS